MVSEFSLGNFRSFKEIQTLQLRAANIRSRFPEIDQSNVGEVAEGVTLLRSKGVFGANGSGKSNLVKGLTSMLLIIRDCLKDPDMLAKVIEPFRLHPDTVHQPSFFQLNFMLDDVHYRYGFEADAKKVRSEWLFGKPLNQKKVRERYYFLREGQEVQVNEKLFREGVRLTRGEDGPPLFRENTLFLSVLAAFNSPLSLKVVRFLKEKISIITGLDDPRLKEVTLQRIEKDKVFRDRVTALIQAIDPGILRLEKVNVELDFPEAASEKKRLMHQKMKDQGPYGDIAIFRKSYNDAGKVVGEAPLILSIHEAEGTKKLFRLSLFLFQALERGKLLMIDEFDARMHPLLTRKIIEQFHRQSKTDQQAQLVFITHDVNLLDARLLRRDQIAFTRKGKQGRSELYSLVEFKGVRNDASFEKDYLLGKYDAVPNNLNTVEEAIEEYVRASKHEKTD
jgi:AAA15 family ATPase/GTPase